MTQQRRADTVLISFMLIALGAWPLSALIASTLTAPEWDRAAALEIAAAADVQAATDHALALLAAGEQEAALDALQAITTHSQWADPARDRAMFDFARALADFPRHAVSARIIDFVSAYTPQTLVAHEEARTIGVPLYPTGAVMAGIRNQWTAEAARAEARQLVKTDPAALLANYASSSEVAYRNGVRAALASVSARQLEDLLQAGLPLLPDTPELTGLLGESALTLRDTGAYAAVLATGGGHEMVPLLRRGPQVFTPAELDKMMARGTQDVSAETRTLMRSIFSQDAGGTSGILSEHNIVPWTEQDGPLGLGYPVPIPVDTPMPFDGFRTYNGLHTRHQQLMADTEIIHGKVVGTTHRGNDVWAYRIGDADRDTWEGMPEGATLTNGGIHAREWQTPEVVTGIMELFAEKQGDHHFYDYLLENVNMIVIPVHNPDGLQMTQAYPSDNYLGTNPDDIENDPLPSPRDGRMRRKNMRGVDFVLETEDDHLLGIDLNRNNSPLWATNPQRSSDDPESLVFHGEAPHSEPEAQALLAAADLGPADQLRLYNDVHSFSQVFYFHRTQNIGLNNHVVSLMFNMSNFNAALPGGSLYLFNPDPNANIDAGFGMTNEYFSAELEVAAFGIEVEPNQGGANFPGSPGCGANYGGLARNCHDGFILPESQIRRVREELAQSISANFYQQAGPPSISAVRFVDTATQAVVFEAEWDPVSATERALYTNQVQPLQLGREYTFWVAYDRPMRWRTNGAVTPFPGQPGSTLDITGASLVSGTQLNRTLTNQRWINAAHEAPNGYFRYQDDTFAAEIIFADDGTNQGLVSPTALVNIQNGTTNMTGQALDTDPSTPITWSGGGWIGWEDDNGADTETGGTDANYMVEISSEAVPDPFVIEPGTSAAWFDVTHDGEGFMIEILENNRAVMYWFTYDANGEQAWFIAVGEVRGNRLLFPEVLRTSGGVFGPAFNPASVVTTVAGSATFLWESCNSGTMVYTIDGHKGRFDLTRLSRLLGVECGGSGETPDVARKSGSWYNVNQDGHGFVIELLDNGQVLVYWFTYDFNGNQAWYFGVGEIDANGELVVDNALVTRGPTFGPDFDPADLEVSDWGSLRFDLDCDGGSVEYDPLLNSFPPTTLALSRLSVLAGLACEASE